MKHQRSLQSIHSTVRSKNNVELWLGPKLTLLGLELWPLLSHLSASLSGAEIGAEHAKNQVIESSQRVRWRSGAWSRRSQSRSYRNRYEHWAVCGYFATGAPLICSDHGWRLLSFLCKFINITTLSTLYTNSGTDLCTVIWIQGHILHTNFFTIVHNRSTGQCQQQHVENIHILGVTHAWYHPTCVNVAKLRHTHTHTHSSAPALQYLQSDCSIYTYTSFLYFSVV